MKEFAMISQSLLTSRKFNSLDDNTHRLAYIFFHLKANYSGVFSYRVAELAIDLKSDYATAENAIMALIDAGLIEYDIDEELARIVGWYKMANSPRNKSQLISQINDLEARANVDTPLFLSAVAELIVEISARVLNWRKEGDDAMLSLQYFIERCCFEDDEFLIMAINKELQSRKMAKKNLVKILPQYFEIEGQVE